MTFHFKILIEGYSEDKESIKSLYENLQGEVWHENSIVHEPEIIGVSRQSCFGIEYVEDGYFCEKCKDKAECETGLNHE
ncbi:MAG: hypothetical protein WC998_07865 [Candidatus Paceibacterota bacterium]|jgi:hypothetical protein